MARTYLATRVEPTVAEQIDKMAKANGITRSQMMEELLVLALGQQEAELSSTFLMPRLEGILSELFQRHLGDLRLLMMQSAIESSVASRLTLFKYRKDNGYDDNQLASLRDQAYKSALRSVRQKGVEVQEDTSGE